MFEYFLEFLVVFLVVITAFLAYERYTKKGSRRASSAYVQALRELLDGRQEAAFAKLRQVVAEDATNLDAYLRLGQILRENNHPEKALQIHRDMTLRTDLDHDEKLAVLRQIVLDCRASDDAETAEAALREMIQLDSNNHWAQVELLHYHQEAEKWDLAFESAQKILKIESNKSKKPLAKFKYQAGLQLFRKREYHRARILLKEAIGLDQSQVAAYLVIGDSYRLEDRHEDAVTFWNKLISAVPAEGHQVIERLQKAFFDLGRFGDIQGVCETILKHSPKNAEARRALAEFYEKKGDVDLAIELWEEMLDDFRDDELAPCELIRLYLESGNKNRITRLLKNLERRRDDRKRTVSGLADFTPPTDSQVSAT